MLLKRIFDKNFDEIFFSQAVSLIGGIIAGTAIASQGEKFLLLPGMLILMPGFLEMRGNISGTFASRLSSGLFLGVLKPTEYSTRIIKGNLIATFSLAILISGVLGILAFLTNFIITGSYNPEIILIAIFAGIIANLIEIPLTLFITFLIFRKGHDPNNIIGPFVTSTGDLVSVISIFIAVSVI